MLNIKKAITVSSILFNNLVSLSLILALFCLPGYLYAQTPLRGFRSNQPALDFPEGREFDPRHPRDIPRIGTLSAISENVELVGATEGAVYDVFVQDNYAYICAEGLMMLDVSAPSNPTKVGYAALPDLAYGVYVQSGLAYVADGYYGGLRIIDVSTPSSPREVGFYDTPGSALGVYVQGGFAYVADGGSGLHIIDVSDLSSANLYHKKLIKPDFCATIIAQ